MTVSERSLADVLRGAARSRSPLTLTEAVSASRVSGASEHITVEIVFSVADNPMDALAERAVVRQPERIGDVTVMWIPAGHPSGEDPWFLALWPTAHRAVYYLVTAGHSTDDRWKAAERWLARDRTLLRTYLDHDAFLDIGVSLSELGHVEVGRVTGKVVRDGSSLSRGWQAGEPGERPTADEVIGMMDVEGASIKTLTLHVRDVLSFHLRRLSGATFYSGDFALFADRVLGPLANQAGHRHGLLVDRQRKPDEDARPLRIALPEGALEEASSVTTLIAELADMPHTTMAVYHRNPYLHLALVDQIDGSTFDVTVTESDGIVVYPGFRVSESALTRVTDRISERFAARSLADPVERSWSLTDLSLNH